MAKRKKTKSPHSDHGPDEKRQHGTYIEVETTTAGVTALRNVTADPISTYWKRGTITMKQHQAATTFANHFTIAGMTAHYSQSKYGGTVGGQPSDHQLEVQSDTRKKVNAALKYIGSPLSSVITHVAGHGETAGTWQGVTNANRPDIEGMVALRLALDGLVKHYNWG